MLAVVRGFLPCLQALASFPGLDWDTTDSQGKTLVQAARDRNDKQVLHFLLEKEEKSEKKDDERLSDSVKAIQTEFATFRHSTVLKIEGLQTEVRKLNDELNEKTSLMEQNQIRQNEGSRQNQFKLDNYWKDGNARMARLEETQARLERCWTEVQDQERREVVGLQIALALTTWQQLGDKTLVNQPQLTQFNSVKLKTD